MNDFQIHEFLESDRGKNLLLKHDYEKKPKAEIQALSSKNLQYISKEYLPDKIKAQDFLP